MELRTRLSVTRLEERETPSGVGDPVDPTGGSTNPSPNTPAQTPTSPTSPTDPHG